MKCLNCGKPTKRKAAKYCCQRCQLDYQYSEYVKSWLAGNETGIRAKKTLCLSKHVKRWLHETRGTACEECGWDMKHPVDGRVLTEIDHVDGDASNNKPDNLKILCPNCHAMTPTFRARNKSSSRER